MQLPLPLMYKQALKVFFLSLGLIGMNYYGIAQPIISGFTPATGLGGTEVTISGSGFSTTSGQNVVRFNGIKANVVASTSNSITCIVPANASYGLVTVSQGGLTGTSKLPFRFLFNAGNNVLSTTSFSERVSLQTEVQNEVSYHADWDDDGLIDYGNLHAPTSKIRIYRNTSQGGNISFQNSLTLSPAVEPGYARIADINGDGKLDLVVFSWKGNSFSVYLNTSSVSNISFANPVVVATAYSPTEAVIVDVNNDGKMDIVLAYYDASFIAIFSNTSSVTNPSFASAVNRTVMANPIAITAGDYNNDGKIDLVVGDLLGGKYAILKNNGNFNFEATNFSTPQGFLYGCTDDFNNDGRPDVAFTRYPQMGKTTVFLNTTSVGGAISFVSTDYNIGGIYITSTDISGDGFPEILVDASPSGGVRALKNKGSGSPLFESFQIYVAPIYGSSVADFTNDGRPDIMGQVSSNTIRLYSNELKSFYIDDFFPTTGTRKTIITITGGDFNGVTGVKFGGVPAESFDILNNSTIEAVPGIAASGEVEITKGSEVVKRPNFNYQKLAYVESVEPLNGYTWAQIRLKGKHLDDVFQVAFGGVAAFSFTRYGDTLIRAVVGSGNSGNIEVRGNNGSEFISGFTFYPQGNFGLGAICPGGTLTLDALGYGDTYQWQESTDSINYTNMSNNAIISGANEMELTMRNIPASWSGKFIRCMLDGYPGDPVKIRVINYFAGTVDQDWNNPQNWSCGLVPDINTEVVLSGNVVLNSNTTVRGLYIQPGANLTIGAGFQLLIKK